MNYKNEMVLRYCYLYDNVSFIYAYFMKEDNEENYKKYLELQTKFNPISEYYKLDIEVLDPYTLYMLESIIFEDKSLEETMGYNYFEELKWNPKSKEKVEHGEKLIEEYKQKRETRKINFELIDILFNLYENIARQSADLENRDLKLKILDEYIRIAKYTNDKNTWHSGYHILPVDGILKDVNPRHKNYHVDLTPDRPNFVLGITNNNLIEETSKISFSKRDKSIIYHYYNDEIPYDTFIKCGVSWNLEMDRPANMSSCQNNIRINPKEIYAVENSEDSFSFFMPCPICKSLIKVDDELIPHELQEEIVWNHLNDPKKFELKYLEADIHGLRKKFNDRYK